MSVKTVILNTSRRYEYDEAKPIYEGEKSKVYKAEDVNFMRPALLKIISGNKKELQSAEKEVLNYCNCGKHTSRIPAIYDKYKEDSKLFIIMEWIEGKSLTEVLERQNPDCKLLNYAREICSVVNILHKNRYTHRDLKPDNIIIGEDNTLYLIDFNLATAPRHKFEGSSGYRAPENFSEFTAIQTKKDNIDVFSIGSILYEMFTGDVPIPYVDFYAEANDTKWQIFIDAKEKRKENGNKIELNSDLNNIITKCLKLNPDDRYRNAGEIERELKKVKLKK